MKGLDLNTEEVVLTTTTLIRHKANVEACKN